MEARAKLLGHPVHQMLIVFPLGLLATAIVFDLIGIITDQPRWFNASYLMMAAGIVGGLIAAPFGLMDWLKIPEGTRAKRVGAVHGLGNVVVLALFAASWLLRRDFPTQPATAEMALSFGGGVLAFVTGWLGGELVNRLGVGVDDGAGLDAPSSLREPHIAQMRNQGMQSGRSSV